MRDALRSGAADSGDRSTSGVLAAATRALVENPSISLSEVAEAIGIGRTTLHRMFPTRRDLLVAIAHDAVQHLGDVYAEAGLVSADAPASGEPLEMLRRLVDLMIPLGPSLMFLLRAPELDGDDELSARIDELDRPVRDAVRRAQSHAQNQNQNQTQTRTPLDPAIPDWWATEMLFAGVYIAWEQIRAGRLAPRDAGELVYRTWLFGISPAPG